MTTHEDDRLAKLARIAEIVRGAEEDYDKMYDAHDERTAKWQYELACDALNYAAKLARELDLEKEALEYEARAKHIRLVFRHQFMQPPDLSE
jgi:acyl-CoA reductase-like NAD-dependent aldehyde dehydrogenase